MGAQLIPVGELATVPLVPVPLTLTVVDSVYRDVNVAVTEVFAVMLTVHVPVPAHADPPQPANAAPAAGVAVKVTLVPLV